MKKPSTAYCCCLKFILSALAPKFKNIILARSHAARSFLAKKVRKSIREKKKSIKDTSNASKCMIRSFSQANNAFVKMKN